MVNVSMKYRKARAIAPSRREVASEEVGMDFIAVPRSLAAVANVFTGHRTHKK